MALDNLIPGMNSILPSTGNLLFALYMLFIIGLLAIFGTVLWMFLQYKYRVWLVEKRGEKDQTMFSDIARMKKTKEGITKLKLFRTRKVLPLPDFTYIHNMGNFFTKKVVVYYRYGEESFTPIRVQSALGLKGLSLTPIEGDISQMVNIMDEIEKKFDYATFWDKWGTLIIHLGSFLILFVMLIITMKGLQDTSSSFNTAAQAIKEGMETMSKCQVGAAPIVGGG